MGDRCYMHVTCRRQDMGRFEALGFALEYESGPESLVVEMADPEANYAHSGEMPVNIPYTAFNGAGSEYCEYRMACDGKQYREVCGNSSGFVIDWDYKKNGPARKSLAQIRHYLAVQTRASQFLQEPHHHAFSIETRLCIHCGVHADQIKT